MDRPNPFTNWLDPLDFVHQSNQTRADLQKMCTGRMYRELPTCSVPGHQDAYSPAFMYVSDSEYMHIMLGKIRAYTNLRFLADADYADQNMHGAFPTMSARDSHGYICMWSGRCGVRECKILQAS
jgi:hypothetical protein